MTNNISEYSAGLAFPELVKTDYDNKLEVALLLKKQTEYDQTLARLNNLQSTALNMAMINLDGAEKLQGYNKELNDMLSQDLGDVTDPRVQARLAGYFTKIAGDDDLKEKNRISQYYLSQDADIQRRKQAKDPSKEGFNSINQFVYENAEGGKNDFVKAKDTKGWDSKKIGYTPYKDIDLKMQNVAKMLHEETKSTVRYDGYQIITETTKGVSKERIATLLQGTLDQDELEQLKVLSQYRILSSTPEDLHRSYSEFVQKNVIDTDNKIKYYEEVAKSYDPNNLPPGLSEQEKEIKKAEYTLKKTEAEKALEALRNNKTQLSTNTFTLEQWQAKGERELLPYVQQLTWENKLQDISNAVSYMSEMTSVAPNRAALDLAKMDLQTREAAAKAHKAMLDSMPTWSKAGDLVSNPVDGAVRFADMELKAIQYEKNTTNIFDSKSKDYAFKEKGSFEKLMDLNSPEGKKFLEENKGNHYLNLWYHYSGVNTSAPTLEGFQVFLEKVQAGDYKNNESIQKVVDDMERDRQVGGWMRKKVEDVQKLAGYQNPLTIKSSEGKNMMDYARELGWDGEGELVFTFKPVKGVPIRDEFGVEDPGAISKFPVKYTLSELLSTSPSSEYAPHLLNLPKGLQELISTIKNQQERVEAVEKAFNETLPTIAQTGQQTLDLTMSKTNKDYATIEFLPKIGASYKLEGGLILTGEDIATISVDPTGMSDNAYFTLSEAGAKKVKEGGNMLRDAQGNEVKPNSAGIYKFIYQSPNKFDYEYDMMFNSTATTEPFEVKYRNHKIVLKKNPISNEITLIVERPGKPNVIQSVPGATRPADIIKNTKLIIDREYAGSI